VKRLAQGAVVVGPLLIVGAFVMWLLAIWNVSGHENQWGGTGVLFIFFGLVLTVIGAAWLDIQENDA
jgi:hypothetical protein